MKFEGITPETENLLTATTVAASVLKHTIVYLPHLLLVFAMQAGALAGIIRRQSLEIEQLREVIHDLYPTVDISYPRDKFDATVLNVVDKASEWVKRDEHGDPRLVRPDHIFIAMLELEDKDLDYVLYQVGADPIQMKHEALVVRAELDKMSA